MMEAMVNAMFGNPVMASAATYVPLRAASKDVRVIRVAGNQQVSLYQTNIMTESDILDVRKSDVLLPVAGDEVHLNGAVFTVRGFELDSEKLVWRLNLDKE